MGLMPWTLYRYILKELLKLLLLSLAVLVTVIATALAIKPLTSGLLGPLTLLKFIFYTTPTILDMAMPFAAAFAGTLVFCRMVADHEIVACRASGMRYTVILTPVVVLGLVLMGLVFYLDNWVVPRFYRMAEFTVQKNLVRLFVSELKEGKPFKHDKFVVYADAVAEQDYPGPTAELPESVRRRSEPVRIERVVMLKGIAIGEIDTDGRLRNDATAERADLLLYRVGDESWVNLRLRNAMYYSGSPDKPWGYVASMEYPQPLPDVFSSRLRFLSWGELRRLGDHPERMPAVQGPREQLIGAMASEQVLQVAQYRIEHAAEQVPLILLGVTDQHRYVVRAPRVERRGQDLLLGGRPDVPVIIEYYESGIPRKRYEAQEAVVEARFEDGALAMQIEFGAVDVFDLRREGRMTQHSKLPALRPLRWPEDITRGLSRNSTFELLSLANSSDMSSPAVTGWADLLYDSLLRLARQRKALQLQRAAMSVASALVLILGAVLSLRLEGRMPLVVYFWSFSLAAAAVMISRSGDNILSDPKYSQAIGVLVIWSGNLLLVAAIGAVTWQIKRT